MKEIVYILLLGIMAWLSLIFLTFNPITQKESQNVIITPMQENTNEVEKQEDVETHEANVKPSVGTEESTTPAVIEPEEEAAVPKTPETPAQDSNILPDGSTRYDFGGNGYLN